MMKGGDVIAFLDLESGDFPPYPDQIPTHHKAH